MPEIQKKVAFFSMEYAVEENFPIYAGGLGILSADLVLQAGQDNKNFTAFGLFYSKGFHAHFPHSHSLLDPKSVGFHLLCDAGGRPQNFSVLIGSEEVWFQVWTKAYGPSQSAKIFLLDTNTSINNAINQKITEDLYPSDHQIFFKQQILLGFGGLKVAASVGISPDVYHLNEGHTAMLLLALGLNFRRQNPSSTLFDSLTAAGKMVVATKHTVLTGGGLHLTDSEIKSGLGGIFETQKISLGEFFPLGVHETHPETFSTTNFLLRFAIRASAVSLAHALAEKKAHSHSDLIPITNGVNQSRWQNPFDPPNQQPQDLTDQNLWLWHEYNKTRLVDYIFSRYQKSFRKDVLTIVWARRFASYKRPELLFSNLDELSKMTSFTPSVQFIIAGQTNPADLEAAEMANRIQENLVEKNLQNRIIFIPEYSLSLALKLTAGADLWLNTPVPGLEASGTSGMKAGINGVLQFSTNDGWFQEVNWQNAGWVLPEENITSRLYTILEKEIIPLYYQIDGGKFPPGWIARMRKTIKIVQDGYTTKRVLEDYYSKLYCPI